MMMIGAWIGAVVIGISLGLLGSGGSILTVPILIYGLGQDEKVAFASSLAIVGLISVVSAIAYAKRDQVDWRNVVWFGVPGMIGSVLGAYAARFVPAVAQLLLFAVVLLTAAVLMLRPLTLTFEGVQRPFWKIATDGIVVGAITGLVGVGGGFLIIPALVLLGGLSMQLAVGTSLIIIAMKSASGFWEYLYVLKDLNLSLDWGVIVLFSLLGMLGGYVGQRLNDHLPQHRLRQIFAMFLLLMGAFILWRNVPRLLGVT
jgi:hypothetical protein